MSDTDTRSPFARERHAYWTRQAEENRILGFHALADRCEAFAATWEIGGEVRWDWEHAA